MIIAGEASGDLHGANLVKALKSLSPDLEIMGMGGKRMAEAGVNILFDISEIAIVGFGEVLRHIRRLSGTFHKIYRAVEEEGPDGLILIDYPGFNLRLAERVKKKGIPIIYYISPQVWAWGRSRVKKIAKLVNKMIVILPFEREIYQDEGPPVEFVGHPLLDAIDPIGKKEEIASRFNIPQDRPVVGLLPGSRRQEIKRLLPIMLKAAKLMRSRSPELEFVLPCASTISHEEIEDLLNPSLGIRLVHDKTYQVMSSAQLLLVASGTATLEAACLETPMVVIYKVSFLSWLLAKFLIRVPDIGLVNVVAGRRVVPEFLQFGARPGRIASACLDLLENKNKRESMQKDLEEVKDKLGQPGASLRAARLVLETIGEKINRY